MENVGVSLYRSSFLIAYICAILVMTQVLSTTCTNFKCQSRTNVDLPCIDEKTICDVHCESKYGGFYITSECHFVKEDPRKSVCVCFYDSEDPCPTLKIH
ncbi:hypothetical protein K7X08_010821 [Anisodus acutangulus]|uniref:Uncharacterized protein n=1 Tax=Anisodus acutangulus TaxID=402998 RepID=A0A9Q1RBB0_9SOLA|nr:hypothetical protein K7X08_010821 [Anisodus acutangulus]